MELNQSTHIEKVEKKDCSLDSNKDSKIELFDQNSDKSQNHFKVEARKSSKVRK